MIYGKKVRLRPLEQNDLAVIAMWRNNALDDFFSPWPIAVSEQARWYERYVNSGRDRLFIIETQEQPLITPGKDTPKIQWRPVGTIGLNDVNLHHQVGEIGQVLIGDKDDRKKGYMNDALKVMVEFAFKEANINRLYVEVFADNQEAVTFYLAARFQEDGTHRQAIWKGGRFRDIKIFSMLRQEYGRS